jgi:putative ABC transport system permease protein
VRRFLDNLKLDIRYGLRSLARNPAFTIAAVVALALGIGANSAIFTIINATLLRPLRFGSPERIVRLVPSDPQGSESDLTFALADLAELRDQASTLAEVAAYDSWLTTIDASSGAERVRGAFVSVSYFDVLGVEPQLGRFFLPDDGAANAEPVVVLSDEMWRTQFGSSPSVLGQRIRLSGLEHTVIGIAPRDLDDPELSRGSREVPLFWRQPPRSWTTGNAAEHGYRSVTAIARLAPGATLQAANDEVGAIFSRIALTFPQANQGWGARLVPLKKYIIAPARGALLLVSAAAVLVILIACANVANLMLARGTRREREFAVRRALGASRGRIGRQLLVESVLLSLLGGSAGVAVAWLATKLMVRVGSGQVPRLADVAVDASTIWFAASLSLMTGLVFGILPAVRASGSAVRSVLQETDLHAAGGKRQRRVRSVLIASEVALAVVLLFGAGLLVRSLWSLYAVDPGIESSGVLTARLEIPGRYFDSESRVTDALDRVTNAISALPGVQSAGLVNVFPFSGGYWHTSFTIQGQASRVAGEDEPDAELRTASP